MAGSYKEDVEIENLRVPRATTASLLPPEATGRQMGVLLGQHRPFTGFLHRVPLGWVLAFPKPQFTCSFGDAQKDGLALGAAEVSVPAFGF